MLTEKDLKRLTLSEMVLNKSLLSPLPQRKTH